MTKSLVGLGLALLLAGCGGGGGGSSSTDNGLDPLFNPDPFARSALQLAYAQTHECETASAPVCPDEATTTVINHPDRAFIGCTWDCVPGEVLDAAGVSAFDYFLIILEFERRDQTQCWKLVASSATARPAPLPTETCGPRGAAMQP